MKKRRGEVVDKMAAAFILQGALDRLARLRNCFWLPAASSG